MRTDSDAEKLRKQVRKAFQMRALTVSKWAFLFYSFIFLVLLFSKFPSVKFLTDSNILLVSGCREAMEYAVQILVELESEEQIRWINKVIAVLSKQKGMSHWAEYFVFDIWFFTWCILDSSVFLSKNSLTLSKKVVFEVLSSYEVLWSDFCGWETIFGSFKMVYRYR